MIKSWETRNQTIKNIKKLEAEGEKEEPLSVVPIYREQGNSKH